MTVTARTHTLPTDTADRQILAYKDGRAFYTLTQIIKPAAPTVIRDDRAASCECGNMF